MKLPEQDVELFYKLYHPLLVYVNKKFELVKEIKSPDDFKKVDIKEINKMRENLYKHPELIESFVIENPMKFSPDELEIIKSWKNFVKGTFFVFRYLKNHTVFLDENDPPKAYGVVALISSFEEMLGPYLPIMINAVLLPFKDKIIYDSIFAPHRISFGGGFRRSMNESYHEAKAKFGIITSLPFSPEEQEQSDDEKLKFYLKSECSRERCWEEIDDLINNDPNLMALYHQEMGKVHSRKVKKRMREIGLGDAWFAILNDVIVASGKTKEEVESNLESIVPKEKKGFVHVFRLKT